MRRSASLFAAHILAAHILAATTLAAATLAAATLGTVSAASAQDTAVRRTEQTVRLHDAVRQLPVARETRRGYDREKFNHWVDADGDCQDTRDEVLAAESRVPVSGCDIRSGQWLSYYDRQTWTDSADVDIDHVVALAEAWDSGARRWNARTRERFANDLGDGRSLVAVTDNVNMSKSDQDPAEWLPQYGQCRYVREWTVVKLRWSLTVNRAERRALVERADRCHNTLLRYREARVGLRSQG